jgi:hypothetical protein
VTQALYNKNLFFMDTIETPESAWETVLPPEILDPFRKQIAIQNEHQRVQPKGVFFNRNCQTPFQATRIFDLPVCLPLRIRNIILTIPINGKTGGGLFPKAAVFTFSVPLRGVTLSPENREH